MDDTGHQLEESIDDLPHLPIPMQARTPSNATFFSLVPKVLSDQWVIFSIVVLLTPVSLLVLDIALGIDVMAEESKAAGRGARDEDSTWFVLAMSIICAIGFALVSFNRYHFIRRIEIQGVQVPCKVVDRGKHVYRGLIDVTLEYQFAGQTFRPRVSITVEQLGQIQQVRINQRNPSEYWVEW